MTKASRDTQQKGGKGKEGERKRTGVPSYAQQAYGHTRGEPDYYIQEHPKMTKRRERRGGEEEGG